MATNPTMGTSRAPTDQMATKPAKQGGMPVPPPQLLHRGPSAERRQDVNPAAVRYAMEAAQQRDGPAGGKRQLTKAQAYALAAQLARQQQLQQQQPHGRPPMAPSQQQQQMVRQQPMPQQQQQQPQQQQAVVVRRKQKVITPQMVKPRPIERRHNIMMRSKHAGSNDSVSDSVNTEATEHMANSRQANARRKRTTKKKEFVPSLERVDTKESLDVSKDAASPNAAANLKRMVEALHVDVASERIDEIPKLQPSPKDTPTKTGEAKAVVVQQPAPVVSTPAADKVAAEKTTIQPSPAETVPSTRRTSETPSVAGSTEAASVAGSTAPSVAGSTTPSVAGSTAQSVAGSTAQSVAGSTASAREKRSIFHRVFQPTSSADVEDHPAEAEAPAAAPAESQPVASEGLPAKSPAPTESPQPSEKETISGGSSLTKSASEDNKRASLQKSASVDRNFMDDSGDAVHAGRAKRTPSVQSAPVLSPSNKKSTWGGFFGFLGGNKNDSSDESVASETKAAKDTARPSSSGKAKEAPEEVASTKDDARPKQHPYKKAESTITVATYELSDSAHPTIDAAVAAHGEDVASPTSVGTDRSKDSLVTEAEIAIDPTPERNDEESTFSPDNAPLSVNTDANMLRHVKTPSGTQLLTINTDILSPAEPSSVLSPRNKEEMEVQLPTPEDKTMEETVPDPKTNGVKHEEASVASFAKGTDIDTKLEQSHARLDELKKEYISLGLDARGRSPDPPGRLQAEKEEEVSQKSSADGSSRGKEASSGWTRSMKPSQKTKKAAAAAATESRRTSKGKNRRKDKGRKKMSVPKKTFLGKKSKVIEEEREYDPEYEYVEETREDIVHEERQGGGEREGVEEREHRRAPPPAKIMAEAPSESSSLSIDMKSTLSDAEFLSVESSITTDQEAFAYKPSIVKRTASFVKNPKLALRRDRDRAHASQSAKAKARARAEEEEIARRMREGRKHARGDNRRREEFSEGGHPLLEAVEEAYATKAGVDDDRSEETPLQQEEMEQAHQLLVHDDTIEEVIVHDDTIEDVVHDDTIEDVVVHNNTIEDVVVEKKKVHERGVSFVGEDDSMYVDNMVESRGTFDDEAMLRYQQEPCAPIAIEGGTQTVGYDDATDGSQDVLVSMGTFEDATKRNQPGQQLHIITEGTQTQAGESLSSYPMVQTVSSKEIATQTANAQVTPADLTSAAMYQGGGSFVELEPTPPLARRSSSANEGTFAHMMESMGLFGASVCMGTSKAMLSCVDTCSDTPHEKQQQRLSSIDDELAGRISSPRSQQIQQLPPTPPSRESIFRGCGQGGDASEKKQVTEEEAEGIFTRALAMALKTNMGEQERIGNDVPQHTQLLDMERMASPRSMGRHQETDAEADMYTQYESVDGRYVPPHHRNKHRKKRVPRNIAVKPKRGEQHLHEMDMVEEEEEIEEEVPELQRTNSLKRTGSYGKSKKGIGKFFKKLSKLRVITVHEV